MYPTDWVQKETVEAKSRDCQGEKEVPVQYPIQKLDEGDNDESDLTDMLQEIRILQNGVQILAAFLVILPFSQGFSKVQHGEKWVFVIAFVCSVSSLVMFNAPAAQHRLERPLRDRRQFKLFATRMIIIGLALFSLALTLATHLVVSEVVGQPVGMAVAVYVALLIAVIWWLLPLIHKRARTQDRQDD